MNIRLIVITSDIDYVECFSDVIEDSYKGVFKMSICSSAEKYKELSEKKNYDIALVDEALTDEMVFPTARLCAQLCDGETRAQKGSEYYPIQKYQRISYIVSELLEQYSKVAGGTGSYGKASGQMTAVWSPAGGVGKTTIAMAYAAKRASENDRVIYLNLEHFSSTESYFKDEAKSISALFEGLGSNNMEILIAGLLQKDSGSGILYFGSATNYDDLNVLTVSDIEEIINGCIAQCNELVVDLPSSCDEKVRYILERSDQIFGIADDSVAGKNKWKQFQTQHSLYGEIADKITMIANKGADISKWYEEHTVAMPYVKSQDPVVIYKSLAIQDFDE